MPDGAPPAFAELYCRSCFSFLTGASHPEELLDQAASLGYSALAITDECSLAGMVRAYAAWQRQPEAIQLIVGTRLQLADGPGLVLLVTDRAAYGRLSSLITRGRRSAEKGRYHLTRADLLLQSRCITDRRVLSSIERKHGNAISRQVRNGTITGQTRSMKAAST